MVELGFCLAVPHSDLLPAIAFSAASTLAQRIAFLFVCLGLVLFFKRELNCSSAAGH